MSRAFDDDVHGRGDVENDAGELKNTSLTTQTMFMNLHEQHAIVCDGEFVTTDYVK